MRPEFIETFVETSLARVDLVTCHRHHLESGCEECKAEHQITIPLSGMNVKHVRGQSLVVSASRATLSNRGDAYRISHPNGSGETALNFVLREDVLLDLLAHRQPDVENRLDRPFASQQVPIDAKFHFAARLLLALAKSNTIAPDELQETTILVADRLFNEAAFAARSRNVSSREKQLVHDAQLAMAHLFRLPVTLEAIASKLHISVFHLCRTYRRVTGTTIWSEIQQLRVREALGLLASGRDALTDIALSLGYAHHSHFTSAFHRTTGHTPSAAARILRCGSLRQVRELLRH